VRTGGQFSTETRAEADLTLTALDPVLDTADENGEPARPVYSIPASAATEAEARIEKANRRLARAGIEDRFTFELTEPYVTKVGEPPVEMFYRDLTLSHPSISFGGWEFVAAVDHLETGALVRSKPGVELNGWRPEVSGCEHCGKVRRRSATYLVEHEDGTRKQVGSSCMTDFLGVKPAGLWALGLDPLAESEDDSWLAGGSYGGDVASENLEVIAVALAATDGGRAYVSRSAAEWRGVASTSDAVRHQLLGPVGRETDRDRDERARIAELADAYLADGTAAKVLAYARDMEGDGDYATNMRVLAAGEHVDFKHTALLASAVSGWARDNDRRAVHEARASAHMPGHLAPVKEKVTGHSAVVEKVVPLQAYVYGAEGGSLVIMRASTGHTLKWKAATRQDLSPGDKLTFTGGTVKAHEAFNGQDQTVLTRVKFEVEPAGNDAGN
jgi:hypothetical protein